MYYTDGAARMLKCMGEWGGGLRFLGWKEAPQLNGVDCFVQFLLNGQYMNMEGDRGINPDVQAVTLVVLSAGIFRILVSDAVLLFLL